MKLASVLLERPIRLPGMAEPSQEVTEDECEGLRYDEKLDMVILGDFHVPSSQVIRLEKSNDVLVCPECEREFANAQALGPHRQKAHGVKGNADR